jgi:hypothetical protein
MDIGTIVDEYSKESMLQANPTLLESLNLVRTALHQEISFLNSLETYIHLLMPQMEDGTRTLYILTSVSVVYLDSYFTHYFHATKTLIFYILQETTLESLYVL